MGLAWIVIITVILILDTVISFVNLFRININSKQIRRNTKKIFKLRK